MSIQAGALTAPALPILESCSTPLTGVPMGEEEAAGAARVLRALADPVRLRLVSLIGARAGGEACVCDLGAAFDLTQPTISHHLKVLREAGIIDSQRRGTWVYYRLVPGTLEHVGALLSTTSQLAARSGGHRSAARP